MPRVCVGGAAWGSLSVVCGVEMASSFLMALLTTVVALLLLILLWLLLLILVAMEPLQGLVLELTVLMEGGILFTGLLGVIVLIPLPHGVTGGGVGRLVLMLLPADPIRYSGLSTLAGTPIKSMYPGTDGA